MYPARQKNLPQWSHPTFSDLKPSVRGRPRRVRQGRHRVACQKCDFDVHAMYSNRARIKEGVLYKDYVTDPKIPHGFVFVEFTDPVDLRQLEVRVNFFGGCALPGEAKFTFRLWFEPVRKNAKPDVIERKLAFKALVGNRAQKPKFRASPLGRHQQLRTAQAVLLPWRRSQDQFSRGMPAQRGALTVTVHVRRAGRAPEDDQRSPLKRQGSTGM